MRKTMKTTVENTQEYNPTHTLKVKSRYTIQRAKTGSSALTPKASAEVKPTNHQYLAFSLLKYNGGV